MSARFGRLLRARLDRLVVLRYGSWAVLGEVLTRGELSSDVVRLSALGVRARLGGGGGGGAGRRISIPALPASQFEILAWSLSGGLEGIGEKQGMRSLVPNEAPVDLALIQPPLIEWVIVYRGCVSHARVQL